MNIAEYMAKRGLTDEDLDRMAAPYETGTYEHSDAPVHHGSHLDAVGKKRVTVLYDAAATMQVADIAKQRGLKPSDIYREALTDYFTTQKRTAV